MLYEILKEEQYNMLADVQFDGKHFKTSVPIMFKYIRNLESSKIHKLKGNQFQQDIEPAGKYMTYKEKIIKNILPGFEEGNQVFNNPLVLWFNSSTGDMYDDNSWKMYLYKTYKAKGKLLSKKIRSKGFDGIITINKKYKSPMEIVDIGMI